MATPKRSSVFRAGRDEAGTTTLLSEDSNFGARVQLAIDQRGLHEGRVGDRGMFMLVGYASLLPCICFELRRPEVGIAAAGEQYPSLNLASPFY